MEWSTDPILLKLGPLEIRYYGLLFAAAFMFGYVSFQRMYKAEGKRLEDIDFGLYLVIAGTIIGARLGHCLFYEPDIYLRAPWRILMVWEGGLASHGGAVGILLALAYYSKLRPDQPFLYVTDRIAYPVAFAGSFIRLGNFFNSEIIGKPTDLPWAITFTLRDQIPRHPSMLYESITYFISGLILLGIYLNYRSRLPRGLLTGLFFIMIFTARFFLEFTKENQVAFESAMSYNMGQWLSVPFVVLGIWLVVRSFRQPLPEASAPIAAKNFERPVAAKAKKPKKKKKR